MRLLLDTHVLLWWLGGDARLSGRAGGAIRTAANEVYASAASAVEIAVLVGRGALRVPENLEEALSDAAITPLPITVRHAAAMRELPLHHDDPFDRLLVAQARCEALTLVTADRRFADYDVPVLPA
jgi:PIN domain nuclease of toxin-antitoxin system